MSANNVLPSFGKLKHFVKAFCLRDTKMRRNSREYSRSTSYKRKKSNKLEMVPGLKLERVHWYSLVNATTFGKEM